MISSVDRTGRGFDWVANVVASAGGLALLVGHYGNRPGLRSAALTLIGVGALVGLAGLGWRRVRTAKRTVDAAVIVLDPAAAWPWVLTHREQVREVLAGGAPAGRGSTALAIECLLRHGAEIDLVRALVESGWPVPTCLAAVRLGLSGVQVAGYVAAGQCPADGETLRPTG